MKRWHQEETIARRNQREHHRVVHNGDPTGCVCDRQVGRFRKKDAYDCGRTRCQICHGDKVNGTPQHKDNVANLRFEEQVKE